MAAGRETGSLAGPGYRTVAPTVGLIPSVAGSTPPPGGGKSPIGVSSSETLVKRFHSSCSNSVSAKASRAIKSTKRDLHHKKIMFILEK